MRGLVGILTSGAILVATMVTQGGIAAAADASVTPTSAPTGHQVTVTGDCGPAEPGDDVVVVFRQGTDVFQPIASEDLPANGLFSVPVTVPEVVDGNTIEPGAAIFEVICDVLPPPAAVMVQFTVLAALGEAPPPPSTGGTAPPGPTAAPPSPPAPAPQPVVASPRFTG